MDENEEFFISGSEDGDIKVSEKIYLWLLNCGDVIMQCLVRANVTQKIGERLV